MVEELEQEVIDAMRADREGGMSIADIRDKHEVSEWSVKKYCKDIKPQKGEKPKAYITPEIKTEQKVSNIFAQEMAKIAEDETRKVFEAGRIITRELGRSAEAYGMDPAEYIRWLQNQFLERGKPKRTWADKRKEFKDFGLSCIMANAMGANINPRIIPIMYMIAKTEK